jgi:hypothetical protein
MGGGKSRAICEEAFDLALDYPGIRILIARRQAHTSIIETTKKTMVDEVLPIELLAQSGHEKKESGGEDYIRLPNGSTFHFIGLEDPVRWFSSELGADLRRGDEMRRGHRRQAHHPAAAAAPRRPLRGARSRCRSTRRTPATGCNAGSSSARQTEYGFRKDELWATGASKPIGDAEFIFAKATDNPHLPPLRRGHARRPARLPAPPLPRGRVAVHVRHHFFDLDALSEYQKRVHDAEMGRVTRRRHRPAKTRRPVQVRPRDGPGHIWEPPSARPQLDGQTCRRTATSSPSTSRRVGAGLLGDPGDRRRGVRAGRRVPGQDSTPTCSRSRRTGSARSTTTRWSPRRSPAAGDSRSSESSNGSAIPAIYTRRIEDRVAKKWTDKTGWDTTTKTRAFMLDTLERVLREKEFGLRSERSLTELLTFVRDEFQAVSASARDIVSDPDANETARESRDSTVSTSEVAKKAATAVEAAVKSVEGEVKKAGASDAEAAAAADTARAAVERAIHTSESASTPS